MNAPSIRSNDNAESFGVGVMGIESTRRLAVSHLLAPHVIHEEQYWLERPPPCIGHNASPRITASRWSGTPLRPQDVTSEVDSGYHVLGIALKTTTLTMYSARRMVHDGKLMSGAVTLGQPAQTLRGIFQSAYDVLHLHVPNSFVAECIEPTQIRSGNDNYALSDTPARSDPVVDQLAHAFIRAEDLGDPFANSYADGIAVALVVRILGKFVDHDASTGGAAASGLPKWRLKRAMEYVDAHLGDSIGLSDMAGATGLSRMHFAAQFRAATGMRPHEYLLRRRIEHAQTLLTASRSSLADIAFDVGFKSQSHFTAVFTRFAGETPGSWRNRTRAAAVPVTAARNTSGRMV